MVALQLSQWLPAAWLFGVCGYLPGIITGQAETISHVYAEEACVEFPKGARSPSGWQYADCIDVWTSWTSALPAYVFGPFPEREMLVDTATKLREHGFPCLVQSGAYADGVGSSSIRHLASWMFAEEIGCDWVTPVWNKRSIDSHGTTLYCHDTTTVAERTEIRLGNEVFDPKTSRCALHNWLAYFGFDFNSVDRPTNGSFRVIEVGDRVDSNIWCHGYFSLVFCNASSS